MSKLPIVMAAAIALLSFSAAQADAADVYFNGVKVTGLRNQSFANCKVRFDSRGNVYITAKGYTVKTVEQGKTKPKITTPTPTVPLARRYFLVSTGASPKSVQYDVDIYVNGTWVKKVRSAHSQSVFDMTRKLKKGVNTIHFAATKNYAGKPRASTSKAVFLRVLLGVGTRGGGTVNIQTTLADFRVTAAQTNNFGREFKVKIR